MERSRAQSNDRGRSLRKRERLDRRIDSSLERAEAQLSLAVFFDPVYERHQTGPGHPERAERLEAFIAGFEAGGLPRSRFYRPNSADRSLVEAVHPSTYVELAEQACQAVPVGCVGELPTGDTVICHDSFSIGLAAAGAALDAAAASRPGHTGFALVRPPGHHAEPARGMGFCIFNNIAIAANWAMRERGPVLVADFDYHHGNGTQAWAQRELASGRRGLGFISTHAYPAYPGTGAFDESQVAAEGFIVDIPLAHSTVTDDFIAAWSSLLPAAARRLGPAHILASAGFDFLAGDPIAGLPVSPRAVDALCTVLKQAAAEHDAGLTLVLEGGYSLENLRASGASLASSFGEGSGHAQLPAPGKPRDDRLGWMVGETLGWLA